MCTGHFTILVFLYSCSQTTNTRYQPSFGSDAETLERFHVHKDGRLVQGGKLSLGGGWASADVGAAWPGVEAVGPVSMITETGNGDGVLVWEEWNTALDSTIDHSCSGWALTRWEIEFDH